jgi:hypothetical protein
MLGIYKLSCSSLQMSAGFSVRGVGEIYSGHPDSPRVVTGVREYYPRNNLRVTTWEFVCLLNELDISVLHMKIIGLYDLLSIQTNGRFSDNVLVKIKKFYF